MYDREGNMQGAPWEWNRGPIGRLLKVAYLTVRREAEEQIREEGLTHTQWSAIGILHHYPGMAASEMEHILMIERPSVTSLINGLVKKELVVRREDPHDARYKRLYLTEEGLRTAERTGHVTRTVDERVRQGMSPEEVDTLRYLLEKLVGVFGKP
ncbi:MarR family winged helix-turn-helix transcriptional regulator [Paenibacillus sp. GCM10027629]|uniref:MarR family winged helix-turn-helix transcriptional regulator n=1 Tax=Paenibacillus sp. GCM10027629 TaxID=3273414 RepID=UPI00363934B2